MRAHGHSKAARKFQFMKVPSARFGVHRLFEQIGLPIKGLEDGFGWKIHDVENSAQLAREGWTKAKASRLSGDSFGVVLHELTNSLIDGWLPLRDMLDALRARPLSVHVCITGRRCPEELIGMADTVTEMRKIKCAYGAGSPVRCGIED
jgi:cob(I)alamin adenosyltransferase